MIEQTVRMKTTSGIWVIFLAGLFAVNLQADTLESRWSMKEALNGKTEFEIAGGKKMILAQPGDSTTVKLNGEVISEVKAPLFVNGIAQSESGEYAVLLINEDRSSESNIASDYHSILRLEFTKEGEFEETTHLLSKKANKMMKKQNRWIVRHDSVLNDGRTARLNFGEQMHGADPMEEMRYSWQVRDLLSGDLYRDEPNKGDALKFAEVMERLKDMKFQRDLRWATFDFLSKTGCGSLAGATID